MEKRVRNDGNKGVGIGGVGGGEGRAGYEYVYTLVYIYNHTANNKYMLGGDEEERMAKGL